MVPGGMRDRFAHHLMAELAQCVAVEQLPQAIDSWLRPHLPANYIDATGGEDCFRRHIAPVLERAADEAEGKLVAHGGKAWTPLYTYRSARLIQQFDISATEMRELGLRTLIDAAEKQRRANINRRRSGLDRPAWLGEHGSEQERPWEAEGISRPTWYRRRARSREVL
jgi:hypothetical protein